MNTTKTHAAADATFDTTFDSQHTRVRHNVSFARTEDTDYSNVSGRLVWSYASEHSDYRPSKDLKTLTQLATAKRLEQEQHSVYYYRK